MATDPTRARRGDAARSGARQIGASGRSAHHDPRRGFRNPWPPVGAARFGGLLRWMVERRIHPPPPDPDPSVFPRSTPAFVAPRAPPAALTATWIGHATLLLQVGGRNVLTDPVFSERASPVTFAGPRRWVPPGVTLEALPPIDVVVLSHNHYDHLDHRAVRALARRFPDARWLVPLGLAASVQRRGARVVDELDWWDRVELGPLVITATPARHFSSRGFFDRNRTLWCGWTIVTPSRRVFFAGDTGYHPEFARIAAAHGPFDLSLLPVGAYEPQWFMRPVHMNPEEAVQAFLDLLGDRGVPGTMGAIHWGTFKLTDEPMDEPPAQTRAAWAAAGLEPDRLWVPRHGETWQG